jgi:hypothetical protein
MMVRAIGNRIVTMARRRHPTANKEVLRADSTDMNSKSDYR